MTLNADRWLLEFWPCKGLSKSMPIASRSVEVLCKRFVAMAACGQASDEIDLKHSIIYLLRSLDKATKTL